MSRRKPYEFAPPAPEAPIYWRDLPELQAQQAGAASTDPTEQDVYSAEFPGGVADFPDPVSRRGFLSLMGASIALGSLAGCRRPVDHILPYTRMPEGMNIGTATWYASVYERRGDALGLLVESHEGRPTKIEGHPGHPGSLGATDLLTQASVLDLYDPDRSKNPTERGQERSFTQFDEAYRAALEAHTSTRGQGLRFLVQPTISPTFLRLRALLALRLPEARVHVWSSGTTANTLLGSKLAFGLPMHAAPHFERTRVIVSLDADFLQTEPGAVRHTRRYAQGRSVAEGHEPSRLYVVEPHLSLTGANADHRLRLPASAVEAYLRALAARLVAHHNLELGPVAEAVRDARPPAGVADRWIHVVAAELAQHRGQGVLLAGARQPVGVHALVHALNAALGNHAAVDYFPAQDQDLGDEAQDLRDLARALGEGQVQTLVILGGNPVYDAPADLGLAARIRQARTSVHLSMHRDETSAACTWHAPGCHYLEAWGDARAMDGTVSVQQPLLAPIFYSRSALELLAVAAGASSHRGHDLVRETARGTEPPSPAFDRRWLRALNTGVLSPSLGPAPTPTLRAGDIAAHLRRAVPEAVTDGNVEVTFALDPKMYDGRHAANAWLQELPDPLTRISWDNCAWMSEATAHRLGVDSGDLLRVSKGERTVTAPVWIMPGQADNSVALFLGWGRAAAGRVGTGRGFDVGGLRTSDALWFSAGVRLEREGSRVRLSQTQEYHRMEGRPVAIEATLAEYREHPNLAERLSPTPRTLPLWRQAAYPGNKWGMAIDLNACTGCGTCVVACQAENNIPVVGKEYVARGREMHWLRVDRYFVSPRPGGADADPEATSDPRVAFQPLACVHCENAPCENVCPVAATVHSEEGINEMAYNRCIGTRYCANNCPYKVRRFNYLNYHNDGIYQPGHADTPETVRMQMNPNVTVRFRGVMEKCTYCIQRIQTHKIAAKREGRVHGVEGFAHDGHPGVAVELRDGELQTACQQACPADAVVFGDLNDQGSRVARVSREDRRYKLLGEIGTQPRTTYLARIRNPNPEMLG